MLSIDEYTALREACEFYMYNALCIFNLCLLWIWLRGLQERQKIEREKVNPIYVKLGSGLLPEPYEYSKLLLAVALTVSCVGLYVMTPNIEYIRTEDETYIENGIELHNKIYKDQSLNTVFYIKEKI